MMEFPLPNELIDAILDNLYLDKATLLNCALVGKAWVSSSQKGIWHAITLESPNSRHEDYVALTKAFLDSNMRLIEIFDTSPHIATYVRSLELRQFEKPSRTLGAKYQYEALHASTAAVVERLTNIKNLTFFRLNWATLAPSLKIALAGAFKVPSVTRVTLSLFAIAKFAELTCLLSHVQHLKVLKITFLACSNWNVPESPLLKLAEEEEEGKDSGFKPARPVPRSIRLDQLLHFHLVNVRAFTTWFQQDWCPFEVQNLHTLQLHRSTTVDYYGTAFMLQYIGANLRELELHGPFRSHQLDVLHLGYTPNLESVKLINVQQTDTYSPVPWILSLFEPLLNADRKKFFLRRLTIDLNIEHVDPMECHQQWDQWAAVDTLLAESEFSLLENVNINLLGVMHPVPTGLIWVLTKKLAFLENRKKLRVRIPIRAEVDTKGIKAITLF
jgi:hypothetical protein